jgi:hypothetical protein
VKTTTQNLQTASSGKQNKTDLFTNFIFRKDLQRLIWQYNEKKTIFYLGQRLLADSREQLEKGGEQRYIKL